MTIAGVYLTSEGIVIGADSTSSHPCEGGMHFFDFNQKVFEIGEGSTFGLITWGLGGLDGTSYRTMIAKLSDQIKLNPVNSISELMQKWIDIVWPEYSNYGLVKRLKNLNQLSPFDSTVKPHKGMRDEQEETEFNNLLNGLGVGFCIAGYVEADRKPQYSHVFFEPLLTHKPNQNLVDLVNSWNWWGVPNVIQRLIFGYDGNLTRDILASGKWSGTDTELSNIMAAQRWDHGPLPIRDAIDYTHACISSTIKAMKFSSFSQVCGGPIELAVITTDRKFRWVRHKAWDAAITDGGV